MKFKKGQIHFLTDVFASIAVAYYVNRLLAVNSFIVRSCYLNVSSDGVQIVECDAKWDSGKNKEQERERGGNPLPHPLLYFLPCSHLSSPSSHSERLEQAGGL